MVRGDGLTRVGRVPRAAATVLRIALLSILLFLCFTVASLVSGLGGSSADTEQGVMVGLAALCVLDSVVVGYPIARSRWSGWGLVAVIALVYFGVKTFLSQIETVVFLQQLVNIVSPEMIPGLFIQGAVVAALFAPLAVLVLGKMGRRADAGEPNTRLLMPASEWVWKLAVASVAYVLVYFFFGALVFIPLAGPAFGEYYPGLEMPWWMLPLQAIRGLVWVALALPIIRMMRGRWWEAGLAVALIYSVVMSTNLLIPTDIMPERIRWSHFVELLTSGFVYGWFVVWLLTWRRR